MKRPIATAIFLLISILFVCFAALAAFDLLPDGVPFSASSRVPPKPEPRRDWNGIEAGAHKVGTHIQPGIYRGISPRYSAHAFRTYCNWQRRSALSDDDSDIIAARTDVGSFYVEIKPTDAYFVAECDLIPVTPVTRQSILGGPRLRDPSENIPPGTYLVGVDLRPDTYWFHIQLGLCIIERLSGVSGDPADSISRKVYKYPDHPQEGPYSVTVEPTDFALHTTCLLLPKEEYEQ